MLYLRTFPLVRRVLLPSFASRLILTRLISSTPAHASKKASATEATAPKKAAKASTKPKAKIQEKKKKKKTVKAEKKSTVKQADMKVPRGPITGWIAFCTPNLVEKKSLVEVQDETKRLSIKWKNMTEAEQKPFYDQAREQNEKRRQQYEEWKNTVDPTVIRAINKQRKAAGKPRIKVANSGVKRPLSSFVCFVRDFRKQDSSLPYGEVLKRASVAWRDLPEEHKKPYVQAYEKDRQAYREQISASQAH